MRHERLMHGIDWSGQDVKGWLGQEKLNGLRALWTGEELVSKTGERFNAPAWFTAGLPDEPLDGELYAGHGTLSRLATRLARHKSGKDEDWQGVAFKVFDAPAEPGGFAFRFPQLYGLTNDCDCASVVATFRVESMAELKSMLAMLKELGGEGYILRDPAAPYIAGRTDRLLKFK
jgi:DNA ligase-1